MNVGATAFALVCILLLPLSSSALRAQGSEVLPAAAVDPTTGVAIPTELVAFDPKVAEHRVDVDFDGLMLSDIVDWLREVPAYHEVNFVVSPRLQDYGLDIRVKLRSAELRDILNAIGIATDNRVMFEVRTPSLIALIPGIGWEPASPTEPVTAPSPLPAYQVVNLRDVLRLTDPDALDEAIRTARELVSQTLQTIHGNSGLAPKLNFHPGSGILVIVGQPDAIRITTQILQNLRYQQPPTTAEP